MLFARLIGWAVPVVAGLASFAGGACVPVGL